MRVPDQEAGPLTERQAAMNDTYTRDQAVAAWNRAYGDAGGIAGEDFALDVLGNWPGGGLFAPGPYTRDQIVSIWNGAAELAKDEYNPDGTEDSHSIRSDSCGDLVVNLAGQYLGSPDMETDAAIAAAWADLEVDKPTGRGKSRGDWRSAAIVAEVKSWF